MPGLSAREPLANSSSLSDFDIPGSLRISFEPGEFLFRQNEATRDLYFIISGLVRIFKLEKDLEVELDRSGPGCVVGEIAFLDGGKRSASGVALEKTEAVCLPGEEQTRLMETVPDWFCRIGQVLAKRLRDVDSRINVPLGEDKKAHVAALISLIAISDHCEPCTEGYEIKMKFLENELVDILNLQFSEVEQILLSFAQEGLLKVERKRVILETRDALKLVGTAVFRSNSI